MGATFAPPGAVRRNANHEHGTFRRRQQCNSENLKCEFDVLGYALESCLGHSGLSAPTRRAILAVLNSRCRCMLAVFALPGTAQPEIERRVGMSLAQ